MDKKALFCCTQLRKSYFNVIEILQLDKILHELLKLFNIIQLGRKLRLRRSKSWKTLFLLLSVLNKPKKRRHASGEDGEEGEEAGEDEAAASDTENDQNVDNRYGH